MKYRATFFLKEPKALKETPINAHFYYHGKRFKIATAMMVEPKHWDFKHQRAKKGTRFQTIINDRLDEMELSIGTIYEQPRREGIEITPTALRDRLIAITNKAAAETPVVISFFDRYEEFITDVETRLQHGTVQEHRTARNHLHRFAEQHGTAITFDLLDALFFNR
jgi:hypothetical protein